MDQRLGHDFSRVRVHTGATAEESARHINARAYTVGHDIVFGAGRFAPRTHEGYRLLAHELTHVIQQSRSPDSRLLMRKPDTPTATKPPVPKPGHTPFNFISESPALENWKVSIKGMLEREFKTKFATFEEAHEHFRKHLRSLPSDAARENFADRMRDRGRKAFYRQEARNPSYAYDPADIARMRNGAAPVGELQLEHMEEVKSKVRGGKPIPGHPERALDPANVYVTEGGPRGTAPVGTKHAEKQRTIEAAKKTSQEVRGKTPTPAGQGEPAVKPPVPDKPPAAKPTVKPTTVPEPVPEAVPEVKTPSTPSVGRSPVRVAVTGIALNVLLFAVAYYLNKRHAEKQVRKFNRDLKKILPEINTRLAGKDTEIAEAEKVFPLVYGNVTVVYTHDKYAPEDYNEGSMRVQDLAISHQNYQTQEKQIKAHDPLSGTDPSYSLTFSVPLFEEAAAEKGASSVLDNYRRVRATVTDPAHKVRLSAAIALFKLANQDSSLKTLVVRDLLGLLKDEKAVVRLAAAAFLSRLKAKIAIRYIQAVIPITTDQKHKDMIGRYLLELQQA